jgi:hypothetical protein
MKSSSFLRWSSLTATLLLGVFSLWILSDYRDFIHGPGQGGWSLYRFREISLPLAPLLLLFASLLIARSSHMPRGLHYAAGAVLIISAPFALFFSGIFILVAAALVLHFLYVRSLSAAFNVA